jgi:SAM-dependent methyltransferase
MRRGQQLYPKANFRVINEPNLLPFESGRFELIFCVFVLEHSTEPAKLLAECERILKPGGKLIILCPDFIGQGKMTSQRAGWSAGTTSQKIKRGQLLDAIVTFYDNRIRIPSMCRKLHKQSRSTPLFMVNLSPVVFEDSFLPDVDAVYITNREEIMLALDPHFLIEKNSPELHGYELEKNLIFLNCNKK